MRESTTYSRNVTGDRTDNLSVPVLQIGVYNADEWDVHLRKCGWVVDMKGVLGDYGRTVAAQYCKCNTPKRPTLHSLTMFHLDCD